SRASRRGYPGRAFSPLGRTLHLYSSESRRQQPVFFRLKCQLRLMIGGEKVATMSSASFTRPFAKRQGRPFEPASDSRRGSLGSFCGSVCSLSFFPHNRRVASPDR